MNIHGEHYALIELTGIFALVFLSLLNAIFVAPANRPSKLRLPLIFLASIAMAVAIILALGAGGFLLIVFGCWALLISLLWLCIALLDKELATSSPPRLYERVLLRMPYRIRIMTALTYFVLFAFIVFAMKGQERTVVSILWFSAAAFLILGLFSVFAYLGMVRNFWNSSTRTQRQIFTVANTLFFGAIGTLIWTKSVYFTQSGMPVLKPRLLEIGKPNEERILFRDGKLFGFADPKRRIVIPARFLLTRSFHEGLCAVKTASDREWGFIDSYGNMVIPPKFEACLDFSEGLAAVRQKDKWGYTDKTGNLKIPARFAAAAGFHNGLAACAVVARRNGLQTTILDEPLSPRDLTTGSGTAKGTFWGVIDTTGEMIAGPSVFGDLSSFHFSPIHVQDQFAIKLMEPEIGSTPSLVVTTGETSHSCIVSIESSSNSSLELQQFLNKLTSKCQRSWYPRGLDTSVELRIDGAYDCLSGRFDAGGFVFRSDFEKSIEQLFAHPLLPYQRLSNAGPLNLQFHFKHQLFPAEPTQR